MSVATLRKDAWRSAPRHRGRTGERRHHHARATPKASRACRQGAPVSYAVKCAPISRPYDSAPRCHPGETERVRKGTSLARMSIVALSMTKN